MPHPGPRFTVHGDGGSFLKYGLDGQEDALKHGLRPGDAAMGRRSAGILRRTDSGRRVTRKVETLRGGYEKYYELLAACLLTGTPPPVDARDSRNGLIVIEAAQRSAAERRTVDV